MSITADQQPSVDAGTYRMFVRAFTALRIFTGLVWLSNGLAKLFNVGQFDWGFFSFNLITRGAAHSIASDAASKTRIAPLGLLLIGPIWIMLWHTGGYLWQYPAEDLFPLVLLAIVPAGRIGGLDRRLAPRFAHRWPF